MNIGGFLKVKCHIKTRCFNVMQTIHTLLNTDNIFRVNLFTLPKDNPVVSNISSANESRDFMEMFCLVMVSYLVDGNEFRLQ